MYCPLIKDECKSECVFNSESNCLIANYLKSSLKQDCMVSCVNGNIPSSNKLGEEVDV